MPLSKMRKLYVTLTGLLVALAMITACNASNIKGEVDDSSNPSSDSSVETPTTPTIPIISEGPTSTENLPQDEATPHTPPLIDPDVEESDNEVPTEKIATTISAGNAHSVAVTTSGTVLSVITAENSSDGRANVDAWRDEDIVSVAAGGTLTLGLRRDGTVVVAGEVDSRKAADPDWQDIVSVAAGYAFGVGLKSDGTVVAFGHGNDGQCDVEDWENITAIATGVRHTVGLRADGTLAITGYGAERQLREFAELYEEDNPIIAVSAGGGWSSDGSTDERGSGHTCVLRADGTVRVVENRDENYLLSEIEKWYDPATDAPSRKIVAIASGDWHIVGLRADGTVVTTYPSDETASERNIDVFTDDIRSVETWADITAISAGNGFTLALRSDGTVLSCGFSAGRPESGVWTDVVVSAPVRSDPAASHIAIFKPDAETEKALEELTLSEALKNNLFGGAGAGSLTAAGLSVAIANQPNQYFYVNVGNLSSKDVEFTLKANSNTIANPYESTVRISGSENKIQYTTVAIPLISDPTVGEHTIAVTLSYPGKNDITEDFLVNVYDHLDEVIAPTK
jgi:hypothetical protein